MKLFFAIAFRNVLRNKTRSMISILAICGGLAALIFSRAFVEGFDGKMIENYANLVPGHIQIHRKDFQKKMGLKRSIKDKESILKPIQEEKDIIAYSERIKDYILLSSFNRSTGALLLGVDPLKEPHVTYLNSCIKIGRYLENDHEAVIGQDLLKTLEAKLGDEIVVMGTAYDGSLAAEKYTVTGVIDSGVKEIDGQFLLITLQAAKDLFVMDQKITGFALRINSPFHAEQVSRRLKEKVDLNIYEVLTWADISPLTAQWLEFDRAFINFILLIVLLIVASGILNTILMGVIERIREFGVLLALGTKKNQIVLMVVFESIILGVFGVALGLLLGCSLSYYFGMNGIDMGYFTDSFEGYYTPIVYPRLHMDYLLTFSCSVFILNIIVSLFPALKAANLKPIEAIHHV